MFGRATIRLGIGPHSSFFLTHSVYTIFGSFCTLKEFCQVQTSLCVQVWHSPILAALLHGTRPAGVSQTLRRGARNGITELSQTAQPIVGWAAITLGIGPHSMDFYFWATVCKTVRPMLSDRCPVCMSCLSVCDVGVLWSNVWTDQDETWHAGRPRTWPHCVRWGPSSPSPKRGQRPPVLGLCLLLPNGCRDQDATWYGRRTRPRRLC